MSDDLVYHVFCVEVSAFAAALSPPLLVGFPGRGFDPPTTGTWLEVMWFPNASQNYGWGNDAPTLRQGIGQVSVCYRPGHGIVGGLTLADQVIAAFPKGTMFADVRVYQRPWVSSVIEQPERVMHPVTIPWRGFDA